MAEAMGFSGLYRSDHFTMPDPPDEDSLECIVSLAYLADHTRSVLFCPLVAPLSFRDPVMLARQAAALDDLSDGRMVLGVGTGWIEREHALFGYELEDLQARFALLEEGLEVITRLFRSDEPVSYEGQFYTLREATLLPRPEREGGPRILIGGSGTRRTPELASLSLEEALESLRTEWGAIAGPPEVVIEQIRAYEQAGVEELMLEWFDLEDIESAEAFASDVLLRL